MIREALMAMGAAARALLRNTGALAIFNLLYAALLAVLYWFLVTREASVWQIVLTALLALAAPFLFFLIQAAGVNYMLDRAHPPLLLRRSLRDVWKLLLISIPLIALAVLVIYLLDKLQAYFPLPKASEAARHAMRPPNLPPAAPAMPLHWPSVLITSLRLLLLGVLLPLTAIHLWIEIAREGLWATIRRSGRVLGRAFSAQSILIYTIGLMIFGLMPYFLIFTRTPIKNDWAELIIFGLRLALAFVLTLWGWVITLGALAQTSGGEAPAVAQSEGAQVHGANLEANS